MDNMQIEYYFDYELKENTPDNIKEIELFYNRYN